MAITNARRLGTDIGPSRLTLASTRKEEEEKEEKEEKEELSGMARLQAERDKAKKQQAERDKAKKQQEAANKPLSERLGSVLEEEEAPAEPEQQLSGMARLQAERDKAAERNTGMARLQAERDTGKSRNVLHTVAGKARTAMTAYQAALEDDPEELAGQIRDQRRALNTVGTALTMGAQAVQAAKAKQQQTAAYAEDFETKLELLNQTILDPKASKQEKYAAKQQMNALRDYYTSIASARDQADAEYQRLSTGFRTEINRLSGMENRLEESKGRYMTILSQGDRRASVYERQADELIRQADVLSRGAATAEANAQAYGVEAESAAKIKADREMADQLTAQARDLLNKAETQRGYYSRYQYIQYMNQLSEFQKDPDFSAKSKADPSLMQGELVSSGPMGVKKEWKYKDIDYAIINGSQDAYRASIDAESFNANDKAYLQNLTEEERAYYNYVYKTLGKAKADKFIKQITPQLTAIEREKDREWWQSYARNQWGGASAFSVLINPMKLASLAMQAADYGDNGRIDANAAYNKFVNIPADIRTEVSSMAEKKYGAKGSATYQQVMSMADNIYNRLITGAFGAEAEVGSTLGRFIVGMTRPTILLMMGEAAADSIVANKNLGMDDTRAMALGIGAGIIEGLTENVSLETMLNPNQLADGFVLTLIKNHLAEGSEEGASDILNWALGAVYDTMSGINESEYRQQIRQYVKNGMSTEEAVKKAMQERYEELALDSLGGALSGGIMGGTNYVFNNVRYNAAASGVGRTLTGDVQVLVDAGMLQPEGTVARTAAEKIRSEIAHGKNVSNADIGKLALALADVTAAEAESQTPGNAQTAGTVMDRIVQKYAQGGTITGQDARAILSDQAAMQALIDGGYLNSDVHNDSDGRKEIVRAAEEYAEDNATQETDNATQATDNATERAENATQGPPVPNNLQQAPQTAQETQGEQAVSTPAETPRTEERGLRLKGAEETLTPQVPERKLTLGNNTNTEVQNNGQQEVEAARAEAGSIIPGRSGERGSGLRAGEQAGQLGRSPEGWRSLSRAEKAAARRAYADDAGITAVSARSLGVKAAAEDSTVRVYPREAWEPDLQRIASKVEKATGKPVTFVLGPMKVNAGGRQLTVRGVNTGSGIIVQADDPSITAEKISTHEAYHAFAAQDPELSARVMAQIRKQFPENRLRQIAETYLDKLYGIADLNSIDPAKLKKALAQVRDEICADAYAGINAFSANADEYTAPARQAVTEARRETAAATERRTGPPASSEAENKLRLKGAKDTEAKTMDAVNVNVDEGTESANAESYSASDTDTAYLAAVEAGDMDTAQKMVDEAAKRAGFPVKGWHQTARDFTIFNTDNPNAAKYDSETPNGIFFKTNNHDIGLEGKKQMAMAINPGRTLDFKDRKEANAWYRKHVEGYDALSKKMEAAIKPIDDEMQGIEDRMFADGITDDEYQRLDEEWNRLLDKMHADEDKYRGQLRELLNQYFLGEEKPYDSIHLGYDGHRYVDGKRENVETYIVFSNKQAKSADPVTYDDNGNVIPLSERFNPADEDIRYSADEEYIPESAAEYGQMKRQGKTEAPKIAKPVSKSTATIAKADLRKALLTAYSIPGGSRAEMGKMIDALADQYLRNKRISWSDRENLINKLWESGVMHMDADDGYQAVRELVNHGRIYVPQNVKNEFGDDWNSFRRKAMGEGIYLVNDESASSWDQWNVELSDAFPGMFPEDEYDPRAFLERVVDLAEKGKGENLSLAEYAAKTGGYEYATEEDMMDNLERQADYALKAFAEKANLEIYLKDRTGVKIAQERQRMGELRDKAIAAERERGNKRVQAAKEQGAAALAKEKQREADRRQKEREHRKEVAQRLRERQAMRELQQKTFKQLQWLSQNQNKMPAEVKKQAQDLLEDMDVLAVSSAEEMHIDNATGKTWKDLRDMYLEAKEKDPNWMPSAQLEKIVMRLDAKKIGDLDLNALQDLYKAAIGLRTELYNRNNLINDEMHRTMDEVYENSKEEIQNARGEYKTGLAQRYADMQLTPMNRFLKMAGWNPDSTWYSMAKGLEAGERAQRKFKTESQRQIAPVLEQYKDWMKTADGQGKNAKWYEIKVPESWEYHMGDKPIFSDKTVTVYMTPAQKVHMYLESKNLDNLRHMEGGRTFADKELYSKGKRTEAFANGTTVRLLPETVKAIVSDLTAEEQALANALEQYYNTYSKAEINRVSNILYGYDKAMGGYYAPIFTNDNYTKSDPGIFDLTAEGVGNLKERQHSSNPSWNISAFDAFEKSVDKTGKFVGLSIPIRNMNTLWNWRESDNSMKDIVSHKWNKPGVDFVSDLLTELQSGREIKHPKIEQITNAVLSKYISATFGFNPSIDMKQLASFPLAGTYLGFDNLTKGILSKAPDTDLISKYTGELDYRLLGYATPETATLKNNPGKLQDKGPLNFIFGGGAITWMDGITVRTLWNGAEQKVRKEQPGLEVGTQEQIDAGQSPFYQAVAKEFEEAVSRSQPMYDTMHRADVMREGDPITRTFTLFKTVPMQELNMLAQTIGEANYYKSIGADKATQTAARQKAGRAFLGILTGNLMIGVISFLNALLKNGAKAYRDKDGELDKESIATGMLKQYAKDTVGIALGGSEAADILSAILFGDKWYGLETPGIEQISSIIEKTIKASTKTVNMVQDSIDVLESGGDWIQYMKDHGGDYVSSVEEIGRMLATYATGLPVDNVKAYLLGAAQHISPAIKTAYEDIMSTADKSGLKGLTGASLEMRTSHIMQDRAGDVSERTVETIAGLYEAGYTDAAPPDVAKKYSVNGEDRTLNASEDQLFREVWRSSVGGALDDITGDKRFKTMSQADQAKVIKRLYDYGLQTAKAEVWGDYNPDKWVTTANDLAKVGVPLDEWLPIQQEISNIPADKKDGKTVNGSKKEKVKSYIDALPYSQDQKKAIYTAAGYTDADDVRWHTGAYGKGWKTYATADTSWLERTPQERTTGLKLPSTPQARQTTTRLQLPSAPQARPMQSGLNLKSAPEAQPAKSGLKLR